MGQWPNKQDHQAGEANDVEQGITPISDVTQILGQVEGGDGEVTVYWFLKTV